MRFSPEWAHYKAFTWHEKPEWFYDTNRRNIWKIVGKCKFGPVWEPHFGPPFSGWRSDDSLNLTWGIQKVLSLVIMKIQSDFGLLFSFLRYPHLKNRTEILDCNLKNRAIWLVDTVLNRTCRTGCDPNIRFSPKWALYKPLTWQKKSQWNCDPNLRKTWETSIFTIFGTFFKIYVFGHNSRRRTFPNMQFSPE